MTSREQWFHRIAHRRVYKAKHGTAPHILMITNWLVKLDLPPIEFWERNSFAGFCGLIVGKSVRIYTPCPSGENGLGT